MFSRGLLAKSLKNNINKFHFKVSINISDIIPIIIVFQSFLFAIVLLTDNGPKKASNRYLAFFLILLGIQFYAIVSNNLGLESNFLISSICIYGFSYGPLLYLYSKSLIYKSYHFQAAHLLHFIPVSLILVFSGLGYSVCGSIGFLLYISLLIYIVLAIREILNYRKVIRETQSTIDQTDLVWLQWTMILFSVALLLDIVDQFLYQMDFVGGISSIHLTIVLLVNWMFYKGLKQPQIFLGITKMDEEVLLDRQNITSPKVPESEEQLELEHIQNFMREHDLYTNPQLNLKELSERLDIAPRRLSYLINTFLNQNFMSFVNDYRIEKAKFQLANPTEEGETVLEVMYDVGFNSKSSFFTIFKQKTGLTPSAYKDKHAS